MSGQVKWLGVLVVTGCVTLTGCSGGPPSGAAPASSPPAASSASGTPSGTPEEQRTSAAAVAAGLRAIQGIASQIAAAAASDKDKATALAAQIEPQWKPIEGTVKANDQNAYLAFEDAFALLEDSAKNGDGAKAARGSGDVSHAVQRYLASYPG